MTPKQNVTWIYDFFWKIFLFVQSKLNFILFLKADVFPTQLLISLNVPSNYLCIFTTISMWMVFFTLALARIEANPQLEQLQNLPCMIVSFYWWVSSKFSFWAKHPLEQVLIRIRMLRTMMSLILFEPLENSGWNHQSKVPIPDQLSLQFRIWIFLTYAIG